MICSKCKKVTDERCFATFRDANGVKRRRGICQECRGQYALDNFEALQTWRREHNKKTRTKRMRDAAERRRVAQSAVDLIKIAAVCADCGNGWPPVAMDFDHVRGKNLSISSMVSQAYKLELILEEIKLCEIVCACCHRIRTEHRKQNLAPRKAA